MIIGIEDKFDAAHRLPNYIGKCANLHGHTWHLEVELEHPEVDEKSGMLMDFTLLKKAVTTLTGVLDHQIINTYIPNPTCENLVEWFVRHLTQTFPMYKIRVKLKEGDGGWARNF